MNIQESMREFVRLAEQIEKIKNSAREGGTFDFHDAYEILIQHEQSYYDQITSLGFEIGPNLSIFEYNEKERRVVQFANIVEEKANKFREILKCCES